MVFYLRICTTLYKYYIFYKLAIENNIKYKYKQIAKEKEIFN